MTETSRRNFLENLNFSDFRSTLTCDVSADRRLIFFYQTLLGNTQMNGTDKHIIKY